MSDFEHEDEQVPAEDAGYEEGQEGEPAAEEGLLSEGAWQPEVYAALIKLINEKGIDSPDYDEAQKPIVFIDCDDTLVCNDLGEAMMRYMITRRKLRTDRGFWHVVPENLNRDALNAAHKAVAGRADIDVGGTAAFRRYRAGMISAYETLRETEGVEAAFLFAARMLRGQHERTVAELVEEVLDYELDRQLSTDEVPPGPPFHGCVVPTGIRVYQEMWQLLRVLEVYGFETWIISHSNQYIMRALARRLEFPEERVLGIEFQIQSGVLTDRPVEPVPYGEDKLELFLDTVGRSPVLAIGDSMEDFEMLENCEGLCIVIDRGDEELLAKARENGWMIQTPLSV